MKNKRNILFAIGITVATVAGFRLGQVFFDKQNEASSQKIRAIVPETVRKLAFPALQNADGGQFDIASLQGKWNLMFFGYMNCPDICPATLSTVAQAKKEIEGQLEETNKEVSDTVSGDKDESTKPVDNESTTSDGDTGTADTEEGA